MCWLDDVKKIHKRDRDRKEKEGDRERENANENKLFKINKHRNEYIMEYSLQNVLKIIMYTFQMRNSPNIGQKGIYISIGNCS